MLSNGETKPARVHQSERFLEAACTLGGGASAEGFAELIEAIAAARPPRKVKTPKKRRRRNDRSWLDLRCGSR